MNRKNNRRSITGDDVMGLKERKMCSLVFSFSTCDPLEKTKNNKNKLTLTVLTRWGCWRLLRKHVGQRDDSYRE